ncbi:MAG: DUF2891 domain-containing protein [Burkholderiales bacterium]
MLGPDLASAFARVALANVQREYPRRLDQLLTARDAEWRPRRLHPAFFGSYDWHSAVHMHWLLARLLRLHPFLEDQVAPILSVHLSPPSIEQELAFFRSPGGAAFERPYGWAWLLELQAELLRLGKWHDALEPLAGELARRLEAYLAALPYPVRAGTHGNTAFACVLALDYAHAAHDKSLASEIEQAARRWYLPDRDYPVTYEPSGDDFVSPALTEALLMKRILGEGEFRAWLKDFLPALGPLAEPPRVTDHADAKQSHLDGLCLSRAWCFSQLGKPKEADWHLAAGLAHVTGGDYAGEHWLATFATLALSAAALRTP